MMMTTAAERRRREETIMGMGWDGMIYCIMQFLMFVCSALLCLSSLDVYNVFLNLASRFTILFRHSFTA